MIDFDDLHVLGTNKTPEVKARRTTGELHISGICVPEDSVSFFYPLKQWLDQYITEPLDKTTLIIDLQYFNTSTSRILLNIFRLLKPLTEQGKDVEIIWIYEEDDLEMEEAGQDYREIVGDMFVLRSKPVVPR